MDGMLISFRWDCLLSSIQTCYCISSCYWKLLKKYYQTVTLVLFHYSTLYTVILSTLLLLHHWYCYCHHIIPVIEIIWILIDLNNNVNRHLTPGLEKLMEETTPVFWEDLGYRLRTEIRFHCRVLGDDWHPILFILLLLLLLLLTTYRWDLVQCQVIGP